MMDHEVLRLMVAHRDELNRWIESPETAIKIHLLEDVAAGRRGKHGCSEDNDYDAVALALDDLMMWLFNCAANSQEIPDEFWQSDIGRLMLKVRMWLECDELITITEAALILRGSAEVRDLMAVRGYIKRGKLTAFTDLAEKNPQKATRVRRQEVEALRNTI